MMNRPLISVIVPVYNTAAYLDKCLESICGQTYNNLEILCVDDGSTDDSLSILHRWAERDRRIIIIHQKNAGLSAARNAALDRATGDFVTGVDSDDFIEPDAYEAVARAIDDEVDMVTFSVRLVDEADGKITLHPYWQHEYCGRQKVTEEHIRNTCVNFCGKVFRRSLVEEAHLRFPVGLLYEDILFYYEAMPRVTCAYFIRESFYNYLQRGSSIMHHDTRLRLRAFTHCQLLEQLFSHYRDNNLLPQWGSLYLWVFMYLYDRPVREVPRGKRGEIRRCFREMVRRQKMEQFFPRQYPVSHVLSDSGWRRLFFWRNRALKIYRFFGFPVLKIRQINEGVEFSLLGFKWQRKAGDISFS